ncbi:MAG: sodium:proton antiporter [Candidatus Bathyarchaeota archaeon]|nr:sodium:proton antiporter [Candidatus Bathyarchaeota archaeon]MDH5790673.1 sodium:proton antiporter [Candidatus Bathyarchaeota archaeon]
MTSVTSPLDAVFNILIIVTAITFVARRFRFPHTIALIFAGLLATFTPNLQLFDLEADIILSVLLPPIIFQETLQLDIDGLIDDSDMILSYAVAGTLLMVVAVAIFAFLFSGFDPAEAFLLGVIISPTDPISVIGTFRTMGVIKRFQLLVTGESLFNDGVAIVIYSILISIVTVGSLTALDVVRISLVNVVGGVLLGIASGFVVHILFCWTDDKFAEVLISVIAAFGVFRLAEELGASGVIATVLAGLIINYRCRNYGGLGGESRGMLDTLWEFVGFTASSVAFIFIGMKLDPSSLFQYLGPIIALTLFIIIARYFMVVLIAEVIQTISGKRVPRNWRLGILWSGLRGAISVVLVLGVGVIRLPHIEGMTALTFGVVLATNLIQGLSMSRVVQKLELSVRRAPSEEGNGDA